jgi:hypothetical protein
LQSNYRAIGSRQHISTKRADEQSHNTSRWRHDMAGEEAHVQHGRSSPLPPQWWSSLPLSGVPPDLFPSLRSCAAVRVELVALSFPLSAAHNKINHYLGVSTLATERGHRRWRRLYSDPRHDSTVGRGRGSQGKRGGTDELPARFATVTGDVHTPMQCV